MTRTVVRRALRLAVPALLLGAVAAPPAFSHAVMEREGSTIAFRATDFVSRDEVTVTLRGDVISFLNPTGFGGLDPGDCRPGRVDLDTGYVIEALCSRAGVAQVRINTGEREDKIVADIPIRVRAIGGGGADEIRTGPLNDLIESGSGDDRIDPGGGEDAVFAGLGNDVIALQDGRSDIVSCHDGIDAVVSFDPVDRIIEDCEPGPPPERTDTTPPVARVALDRRQHARRNVSLRVTANEPARFVAQAYLIIGDRDYGLKPGRGTVSPPGARLLRPRLSARELRLARRALRRHQRVRVVVAVVATDAAGNSSIRNVPAITIIP